MIKRLALFPLGTAASVALSVLAACGSDDEGVTGPATGQIDPVMRAAQVDSVVNEFITGNTAISTLGDLFPAIGDVLAGVSSSAAVAVPVTGPLQGLAAIEGLARSIDSTIRERRVRQPSSDRPMAGIPFPAELLGKTLIWNPDAMPPGLEVDPNRTGAPANGVRFILYESGADHLPVVPLVEIGHLDIIDTSTFEPSGFPNVDISSEIVIGGVTLLFLDMTGTIRETGFDFTFSGFLSDGAGSTFNYSFDVEGLTAGLIATFSLDLGGFTLSLDFNEDPDTEVETFVITLADASTGESLLFLVTVDAQGNASGTVSFVSAGGETTVIAIISGTEENPVITNAAGNGISPAELAALRRIVERVGEIFEFFEDLFDYGLSLIPLELV